MFTLIANNFSVAENSGSRNEIRDLYILHFGRTATEFRYVVILKLCVCPFENARAYFIPNISSITVHTRNSKRYLFTLKTNYSQYR